MFLAIPESWSKPCAFGCLAFTLVGLFASERGSAQGLEPDGTTLTSVSSGPSERPTVSIAPINAAGTSLNKYKSFNVGPEGLSLDNHNVHAKTIVNEVTGTGRTALSGEVEVRGPQASVIIANPNGISINGLSVRNNSVTAVLSGRVSLDAGGNPSLSVSAGDIKVDGGGITGIMNELDLLAKEIRISAPISGDAASSSASVKLIAGSSQADFAEGIKNVRSGPTPSSTPTPTYAVDISGTSLTASGPIRLTVTEQGAGVRIAGNLASTAGDIRISSSGDIHLSDAKLEAHGAVSVTGNAIVISSPSRQSEIKSLTSGVTLSANTTFTAKGAKISGVERDFQSFTSLGGVTIASGSLGLSVSEDGAFDSVIASTKEDVALQGGGSLNIRRAEFSSDQDLLISAADDISLATSTFAAGRDIRVLAGGDFNLTASALKSEADTRIESSSVELVSTVGHRAEVVASNGAVYIKSTTGSVTNRGALVDGKQASLSDPDSNAAVTVLSAHDVDLSSVSLDELGVFFGRSGNLRVDASDTIRNTTGRLFSNAAISLTAGKSITNTTALSGHAIEQTSTASGKRSWRTLWLKREKLETFEAFYGAPTIAGEQALVTAIGDVSLTAPVIVSRGAQISGDKVDITAHDALDIESLATGAVRLTQRCGLITCWADGSSSTGIVPAAITAASTLHLSSQGSITSHGARVVGGRGLIVSSPRFSDDSVTLPFVVTRPSGLTGVFKGNYGWLSYSFDGGFLSSPAGSIQISTAEPVDLSALETYAAQGIVVDRNGTIFHPVRAGPDLKPMSVFRGVGL